MERIKEGNQLQKAAAIQREIMATFDNSAQPVPFPALESAGVELAAQLRKLEEDMMSLVSHSEGAREFVLSMQEKFIAFRQQESVRDVESLRGLQNLCATWRVEGNKYHTKQKELQKIYANVKNRLIDMSDNLRNKENQWLREDERAIVIHAISENIKYLHRTAEQSLRLSGTVASIDNAVLMLSMKILPALAESKTAAAE